MTIRVAAVIKHCTPRRDGFVVTYEVSATDGTTDKRSLGTVTIPFGKTRDAQLIRNSVAALVLNHWTWTIKPGDIYFPGGLHDEATSLGLLVAAER
jgi:hypothetical protein